jgi:hypothetical protein
MNFATVNHANEVTMAQESVSMEEIRGENGKARNYAIYRTLSYPLPQMVENGAIAILSTNGEMLGYYYKNGWLRDNGNRVGGRKKLTHFPDKCWHRWVLHDDGSPESLRWEYEDTIRNKNKKKKEVSPDLVIVGHKNTRDQSNPDVQLSKGVVVNTPLPLTPAPTPPSSEHPNRWIYDIIGRFQGIFKNSPETAEKCCAPLWLLLEKYGETPIPVVKPGNTKADGLLEDERISIADLLADLTENKKKSVIDIQDSFRSSKARRIRDLIAALVFDSKGEEEDTPIILGAVNVPPHEEGSKGISISLPYSLRNSGFNSEVPGGFPDETSVITSLGYVTEPHRDYFAIKQHILHSKGLKLWLIWPPTRENLKAAAPFLSAEHKSIDFTISKALEVLTGLEVCYCKRQDEWFTLGPSAIHAVISVTASGHKNKLVVDYESFDEWDFAYCLIIDTLVSTHRARGRDRKERQDVINTLRESCKAFLYWDALLEDLPDHPSFTKTKSRLDEIKSLTDSYIRALGPNVCTRSSNKRKPSPALLEEGTERSKPKLKGAKNKNKK